MDSRIKVSEMNYNYTEENKPTEIIKIAIISNNKNLFESHLNMISNNEEIDKIELIRLMPLNISLELLKSMINNLEIEITEDFVRLLVSFLSPCNYHHLYYSESIARNDGILDYIYDLIESNHPDLLFKEMDFFEKIFKND